MWATRTGVTDVQRAHTHSIRTVSYTHLDVYKRQEVNQRNEVTNQKQKVRDKVS